MTRRLILLVVAVAVIGGLGFWTYDRYLGRELRQGEELRDALAEELKAAGFAYTSMEYDWRARRVIAEGLAATKLPEGVTGFSIGKAVYRGAKPETIRAALAEKPDAEPDGKSAPADLVADLVLSDIFIGLEGGTEFKQESLTLKHVSLEKPLPPDSERQAALDGPLLLATDLARRFHIGLLEAKDIQFLYPESEATYEQKLVRLEDYRAGNFSEFRAEGMNLAAAVVFRVKLDEYFIQSVKARKFLANIHKSSVLAGLAELMGRQAPEEYAPLAESGVVAGDVAIIGFEMLIPGVGRIAFEEVSESDRQFINGVGVGGNSKVVALELQFNMLTQMLTAGLDAVGVDLASATEEAGSQAQAWLAERSGIPAPEVGPVTAALMPESGRKRTSGSRAQRVSTQPPAFDPEQEVDKSAPSGEKEGEGSASPESEDGTVEQGPAAPVPEVWGNKIKPPQSGPGQNNKKIAEFIRKLGFDDMRIDSESSSAFDSRAKVWELSRFAFDMQKFWNLGLNVRLSGMGALEDLGHVPLDSTGWWTGPKADAVGDRFLKEGRFEGLSFTYRDQGFLTRLMALIAEEQETTVDVLAANFVNGLFGADPLLQAEGLQEAVTAFLVSPELFSVRLQPAEPVPLGDFKAMNEQKTPLQEIASRVGLVLTFNDKSFSDFKKSAAIGSDIQGEQD